MTDDEIRMAHELADHAKTTVTKLLRGIIRELHAERIGKRRRKPAARSR